MKNLLRAQKTIEGAQQARVASSASTGDLGNRTQAYRPARVPIDVRRQSPLVAIYRGAAPREVLQKASQLPPILPPNRTGFASGSQLTVRAPTIRQSAPGYGGKTRLGGASSFHSMMPVGTMSRAQQRVAEVEGLRKQDDMNMRIFESANQSKCDEIDATRDAKLALPKPQLADYAFELAQQIMMSESERRLYAVEHGVDAQ